MQAWREPARGARTCVALLIHVDGSNLRDVKKEPRNSRRVKKKAERELRNIIIVLMEIRNSRRRELACVPQPYYVRIVNAKTRR